MVIPRRLPAVLGTTATLTTTAALVIHIVLAQSIPSPASAVRITTIVAATLEAVVLVVVVAPLACSYLVSWKYITRLRRFSGIWFGAGLFLCTVAAAVTVASIICLNNATASLPSTISGSTPTGFLVASSVALGFSFATQLIFLVCHFATSRWQGQVQGRGGRLDAEDDGSSSQQQHIKSIPYHQTSFRAPKAHGEESFGSRSPPGSSGGRSATETMSSIRSSLSNVVRPISSKTRLLSGSQRSHRRPASLDSSTFRDAPTSTEDGFDSWDTSAVDPQNRQTVLETSSPQLGRFLETIPASPTTSRSPSPGTPLDLEPPRSRRRSRSYSPASTRTIQAQRTAFTQQSSQSESHIHPLFRTDSLTPPPAVTPGTMVVASPNAGQVISDRSSIRSLARMRSGSLPTVPSPLSTQASFDSFRHRRVESTSPELREEDEVVSEGEERKMTPPIPEWILSAGSRTSLSGYNSRKLRTPLQQDGPAHI